MIDHSKQSEDENTVSLVSFLLFIIIFFSTARIQKQEIQSGKYSKLSKLKQNGF